jgi:hypothetical protein
MRSIQKSPLDSGNIAACLQTFKVVHLRYKVSAESISLTFPFLTLSASLSLAVQTQVKKVISNTKVPEGDINKSLQHSKVNSMSKCTAKYSKPFEVKAPLNTI